MRHRLCFEHVVSYIEGFLDSSLILSRFSPSIPLYSIQKYTLFTHRGEGRGREMSSTTFQRLSERTKNSKAFFYSFCAVLGSIPVTLGYFTMKFTNSNNAALEARLRQSADPNLTVIIILLLVFSLVSHHFFNSYVILLLLLLLFICYLLSCFLIDLT